MQPVSVHWFRRDLRLDDNAALFYALKSGLPVLPVFIFDFEILDDLKDGEWTEDRRVTFIYKEIERLKNELREIGSDLLVYYGKPVDAWKEITAQFDVKKVFANHDYEPYAIQRDNNVQSFLESKGMSFHTYKDQVIFEKYEVVKDDGNPYMVYTPYSKKWKALLSNFYTTSYPTENYFSGFYKIAPTPLRTPESMGFKIHAHDFPRREISIDKLVHYAETRDFPAVSGTSRLSVHLRFGTVSIRKLVQQCIELNAEKYLNELIWREFYMMILFHFPKVVHQSFRPEFDKIKWRNNPEEFDAWKEGRTGYPIVDAGMRELNETGYMHNRVRMITASFLTKHLLIDWRWGEAYFAKKLLDYELASNNGGWQWAAGCGVDAAPYFRVFSPQLQMEKFDKNLEYIKKWIPVFSPTYLPPIVDHKFARERCLETFQMAVSFNVKKI